MYDVISKIADDGCVLEEHWRLDGKLHCTNGPAIRKYIPCLPWFDGYDEHWYLDGQLHRTDGPAVRKCVGLNDDFAKKWASQDTWEERWLVEGKLHRTDGPAIVIKDEEDDRVLEKHWYIDGKIQRTFQYDPKRDEEEEKWYKDDVYHRTDGPAHVLRDGYDQMIEESWYSHGKLHRIDGPAHRLWDGGGLLMDEEWYSHGKLHRTDGGSAYTRWDGDEELRMEAWYVDGLRHRTDRPAFISYEIYLPPEWWLQGVKYDCRKKHRQAQILLSGRQKVMKVARVLTLEAKLPTDILSTIGGFM